MSDGLRRHLAFGLVMVVLVLGLVRIAQYNWREGATIVGGSLLVAAALRAVLPADRAGLLAIRGRSLDTLTYAAFGGLVIAVALTITGGPFAGV